MSFSHNLANEFRKSRGEYLRRCQQLLPFTEKNYHFIEYLRKAYEYETNSVVKEFKLSLLRYQEAYRDYFTGKITEIHNLVQFDQRPSDLKEARWNIYKISLSFEYKCKEVREISWSTLKFLLSSARPYKCNEGNRPSHLISKRRW